MIFGLLFTLGSPRKCRGSPLRTSIYCRRPPVDTLGLVARGSVSPQAAHVDKRFLPKLEAVFSARPFSWRRTPCAGGPSARLLPVVPGGIACGRVWGRSSVGGVEGAPG